LFKRSICHNNPKIPGFKLKDKEITFSLFIHILIHNIQYRAIIGFTMLANGPLISIIISGKTPSVPINGKISIMVIVTIYVWNNTL
jgi:hypothetical protein